MPKELTRQMLKEMGIYSIDWDESSQQWWVDRYWFKCGKVKEKTHIHLKVSLVKREHKYAPTKEYYAVGFCYENKSQVIPLNRLVWAWFNDIVPQGYDVDHIDNDPLNNRLENLQLLTREQNLAKRYLDNPNNCKNQYDYCKKHGLKL